MSFQLEIDDDTPIWVELYQKDRGEEDVALSHEDIPKKSIAALKNAMATIYGMARRIVNTIKEVPHGERPDTVEVEFALKLTTDAKAFIVNASSEGQIKIALKWQRKPDNKIEY